MSGINSIGTTDYSWLFSTKTQRQDSISQLWSSYNNYHSNATSALAGINEINTNLQSLMTSYDDAKTAFNAEFEENMSALSESAKQVSRYSFHVVPDGAITKTETTDPNGIISTSTTYSKDLQSALDAVSNFVSNYNSSLQFLPFRGASKIWRTLSATQLIARQATRQSVFRFKATVCLKSTRKCLPMPSSIIPTKFQASWVQTGLQVKLSNTFLLPLSNRTGSSRPRSLCSVIKSIPPRFTPATPILPCRLTPA